ncbi:hypothetical protein [Halostagnicola sp. A56]|nr:hypothetical protein [Halostagnicola sp. A56]
MHRYSLENGSLRNSAGVDPLETGYTDERIHGIHALVLGGEVTGFAAYE